MKRLIPLWIAALAGFVLIAANFIPATEDWSEKASIWFDILAAIAFILGGGNLLKVHLKKTSNRAAGWGYSLVVIVSFLAMLFVGLVKWGAPPADKQEHYGKIFAELPLESLPAALAFDADGSIPSKAPALDLGFVRAPGEELHLSVRRQLREIDGTLVFRGWMRGDQRNKLLAYAEGLDWQCAVERLYEKAQPPAALTRDGEPLVAYYVSHSVLAFTGHMRPEHRDALLALDGDANWEAAVLELYEQTQATTEVTAGVLPPLFAAESLPVDVAYDPQNDRLTVTGPMSVEQRDELADLFPLARPLGDAQRQAFLGEIRDRGDVGPDQTEAFHKILDGSWTVRQLQRVLNEAGEPQEVDRTACEMLEDREAGITDLARKKTVGEPVTLNADQEAALARFSGDVTMTAGALVETLQAAGEFTSAQTAALHRFLGTGPTVGQRNRILCIAMMKAAAGSGPGLNERQRDLLLDDYRAEVAWRGRVRELFLSAHVVKFPWSGEYRAQGTPFWWLYEYAFKPLQATTFAMLAFYVASAAFRAFRAKNVEAVLLLGTAFIILLGRTFAGVFLTDWLPDALSGLRIENLTVYIMQVFNTAGNRAIMIGIALGIASTSLKVLLGVDRSYLGSGEE